MLPHNQASIGAPHSQTLFSFTSYLRNVDTSPLGGPWRALAAGRVVEARNAFAAMVMSAPGQPDAWIGLTLALWRSGDRFAALGAARRAVAHNPDIVDAPLILAGIQRQVGDVAGAQDTLEIARRRYPDNAALLRLLSDVYRRARRLDDAYATAQRALEVDSASISSIVCWADALLATERYEGADKAYRVALALDPNDVRAAFGLGRLALQRADWSGAYDAFQRARVLAPNDPDIIYNLALLDLRFGRYAYGFARYPLIMDTSSDEARYYYYHEGVPLWNGDAIAGRRLVISSDQGLGDHIMMARFLAALPAATPPIIVETPPPLLSLFTRTFPHLRFERFTHWQPAYTMDVHLPITQLPHIAGIASATDIVARTAAADVGSGAYLRADAERVAAWRSRIDAGATPRDGAAVRTIGIVWHGNRVNTRERWRGAPLEHWAPLAALPNVRFHSLQFEATDAELAAAPFPLEPTHRAISDFDDLAAAMTALDAIITVDTAAVHLAGALGVPTYLANPLISDYRWLIEGEATPWYATVNVIRQPTPDAWAPVFQSIAQALAAH